MVNLKRLEPNNKTYDIDEGIQAKIKDPLWMLGRQWQMKEFTASNGGQPIRMETKYTTTTVNKIIRTEEDEIDNIQVPLEKYVEEKEDTWDPKHLEYRFSIKSDKLELIAREYNGKELDWYHFDVERVRPSFEDGDTVTTIPNPIKYYGMPHPRFWSHEDGQVNIGDFTRPHYNLLTMLLIDYGLLGSQDWYSIPITHKVGDARKIIEVRIIDSFGFVSKAKPVQDSTEHETGFELFTMENVDGSPSDPSLFYFPNNLQHSLESEPLEELSFFRDEMANLVWAIEHRYQDDAGKIHARDEELEIEESDSLEYFWDNEENEMIPRPAVFEEGEPGNRYEGPISRYIEKRIPPEHWVPYLPQFRNLQVILRRGRTRDDVQYKGKILNESKLIAEEEIPRAGIKIKRVLQLAREADTGNVVIWNGRTKTVDRPQPFSGLVFDQIEKATTNN